MKQSHKGLADAALVDDSSFSKVNICTKCGNRAVSGLCDFTLQGNMTRTEYFKAGTEPTESCDCHVSVTICKANGHETSGYCPDTETKVYLYSGTEGTEDAAYVVPEGAGVKCEEHTNLFDKWFGDSETTQEGIFPWNW